VGYTAVDSAAKCNGGQSRLTKEKIDFPFFRATFTGVLQAKAAPKKGKIQAPQRLKALHFAAESTRMMKLG